MIPKQKRYIAKYSQIKLNIYGLIRSLFLNDLNNVVCSTLNKDDIMHAKIKNKMDKKVQIYTKFRNL